MKWFAISLAVLGPAVALPQVKAEQVYNGVNRPLRIRVEGAGSRGELRLLSADGKVEATTPIRSGPADLDDRVTDFWKRKPQTWYLQLLSDGRPKGPALVLQPMQNPPISKLAGDGKTVEFVPDEDGAMFNGFRAYPEQLLEIETDLGKMTFRLRPDCAPNTAYNIRELAAGSLYKNTIFHRVVAKRPDGSPFVIQGGDPTGTGSGGPGFAYPLEKSTLPHDFGVISIARSTDPNTNGCQFFVCLSREGTKHLDGRYASFGQLVSGADVVRKIAAVPVGPQDRPLKPPVIRQVRLIDAPPRPLSGQT